MVSLLHGCLDNAEHKRTHLILFAFEACSLRKCYLKSMFVPNRKHYIHITDIIRLMRVRKIITVYSENRTKQVFWVAEMQSFVMLKQVVHVVSTVKQWVNSHKNCANYKIRRFQYSGRNSAGLLGYGIR